MSRAVDLHWRQNRCGNYFKVKLTARDGADTVDIVIDTCAFNTKSGSICQLRDRWNIGIQ